MGKYDGGAPNKLTGLRFRPAGGPCSSSIITMFLPPIVQSIILAMTGQQVMKLGYDDLAENVRGFSEAVSKGQDAALKTTPGKHTIVTSLNKVSINGDDFCADMTLAMNDTEVFSGTLRLTRASCGDPFMFAVSLMDSLELFFYHLLQCAAGSAEKVCMEIGLARLEGSLHDPATVKAVVGELTAPSRRKAPPEFDTNAPFGVFPSAGFEHFYGGLYERGN